MKRNLETIPSIIVSCQSRQNQPFYDDRYILEKIIDSVVLGGAVGLRINGSELISYVKQKYPHVFVMGFKKVYGNLLKAPLGWITPAVEDVEEVFKANPDAIILDADSNLHTKETLKDIILLIKDKNKDMLIGCDIGTEQEAVVAMEAGADFVLTTFVEAETRQNKDRSYHIQLVSNLVKKNIPVVCEGGVLSATDAMLFLKLGTFSVVIGKVIVDPVFNTRKFVEVVDILKQEKLKKFFFKTFSETVDSFVELSPHGSSRRYFKIISKNHVAIGTIGHDLLENKTFILMSEHLFSKGIRVPKVFAYSEDYSCYLQEYISDQDLFSVIQNTQPEMLYQKIVPVIDMLDDFQKKGTLGWDFNNSYPFKQFDLSEIERDFNRFVKKFLDNLNVPFDVTELDIDKKYICENILSISLEEYSLMHRDFQSRNILVSQNVYTLIDYQNSRYGPIYYDLASFLYQSQVIYSDELINSILEYFLSKTDILRKNVFKKTFTS